MASILVFLNRRGAELAPRSKRVLAQARRIASHLGATLYAVAAEHDVDNDGWIGEAGLAGADKVVLLSFGSGTDDHTHHSEGDLGPGFLAAALQSVADALAPNLMLFDHDALGATLAELLAAHVSAPLFLGAEPVFAGDEVVLEERTTDRLEHRLHNLGQGTSPVVATLSTAGVSETAGRDDADVIFFKAPKDPIPLPRELASVPVSSGSWEAFDGAVVVCAGLGALSVLSDVRSLAEALDAPLVYTRELADEMSRRGEAHHSAVADGDAHQFAPRLCVTCGSDTSEDHLRAIAQGTQIVALGASPKSPSIRAARYALLGSIETTLPGLTKAVAEQRLSSKPTSSNKPAGIRTAQACPAGSSEFTPRPDAVELVSAPTALLDKLLHDGLWSP